MKEFKIQFQEDWFKKGDIIKSSNSKPIVIIDVPKRKYYKWYWKILNIITFKIWFNGSITYTVSDL